MRLRKSGGLEAEKAITTRSCRGTSLFGTRDDFSRMGDVWEGLQVVAAPAYLVQTGAAVRDGNWYNRSDVGKWVMLLYADEILQRFGTLKLSSLRSSPWTCCRYLGVRRSLGTSKIIIFVTVAFVDSVTWWDQFDFGIMGRGQSPIPASTTRSMIVRCRDTPLLQGILLMSLQSQAKPRRQLNQRWGQRSGSIIICDIASLDNLRCMDSCYSGNLRSATSRFHQPQSARTVTQLSGGEGKEGDVTYWDIPTIPTRRLPIVLERRMAQVDRNVAKVVSRSRPHSHKATKPHTGIPSQ